MEPRTSFTPPKERLPLHADARQGIGRLRLALPDRPQITGRLQFPAHLFSHLRGGVLRELVDDLCIFESF